MAVDDSVARFRALAILNSVQMSFGTQDQGFPGDGRRCHKPFLELIFRDKFKLASGFEDGDMPLL